MTGKIIEFPRQHMPEIDYGIFPRPEMRNTPKAQKRQETSYHETLHVFSLLDNAHEVSAMGKEEGLEYNGYLQTINPLLPSRESQIGIAAASLDTPFGKARGTTSDRREVERMQLEPNASNVIDFETAKQEAEKIINPQRKAVLIFSQILATMGKITGNDLIKKAVALAKLEAAVIDDTTYASLMTEADTSKETILPKESTRIAFLQSGQTALFHMVPRVENPAESDAICLGCGQRNTHAPNCVTIVKHHKLAA